MIRSCILVLKYYKIFKIKIEYRTRTTYILDINVTRTFENLIVPVIFILRG